MTNVARDFVAPMYQGLGASQSGVTGPQIHRSLFQDTVAGSRRADARMG